jgi:hypothetical protein
MEEYTTCLVVVLKNGTKIRDELIPVDDFPDECPFCHQKIHPSYLVGFMLYDSVNRFDAIFQCPDLTCEEFIQVMYIDVKYNEKLDKPSGKPYVLSYMSGGIFEPEKFDRQIRKISPKFIKIYNQALEADAGGLKEISGLGFRKALEFLLKDYTTLIHPQDKEKISKMPISQVINIYVKEEDIKQIAHRAIWLGNDWAHYTKAFENNTVEDLRKLIKLTTSWIEFKHNTEKYKSEIIKRSK